VRKLDEDWRIATAKRQPVGVLAPHRRIQTLLAIAALLALLGGAGYLGLTLTRASNKPAGPPARGVADPGGAGSRKGHDPTGVDARAADGDAPEPTRPAGARTTPAHATAPAIADAPARSIGQLIISPLTGTTADARLLSRIRAGRVGGVILFEDNIHSTAQVTALTASLQHAARAAGHPGLFIMTDQEGGTVKRLTSQPPNASAAQMGASGTAAAQGEATGRALAQLGINVDLAPVADVPVTTTSFLGSRAFGRSAIVVSRAACKFSAGLHRARIVSSLKHFPGLGRASGNTDTDVIHIDARHSQLRPDLRPYRRCANEPQTMVMVSNAAYSGLTGRLPAVISPNTYRLLRSRLRFAGVTISDSLNATAVSDVPNLAVTAAAAGLDLQLWTSIAAAAHAYRQLRAATKSGEISRTRLLHATTRVYDLKRAMGLL
jgi:beta-N-acetylhexosaminidase